MLINKVKVLVLSVEIKEKKDDHSKYAMVGMSTVDDGKVFNISVQEKELYSVLTPFTPATVNLSLTDSKYGLRLAMVSVSEVGTHI